MKIAELFPKGGNSARITITAEHTVINGKHYRIVDGYVHKRNKPATVKTKDILNIERQTLRLKRMLVYSLILFGLIPVIFGASRTVQPLIATARSVGQAVTFADYVMNTDPTEVFGSMADELTEEAKNALITAIIEYAAGNEAVSAYRNISEVYGQARDKYEIAQRAASGDYSGLMPWVVRGLSIVMCAGAFIGSVVFMVRYMLKPLRVLRISALGRDFAVEVRYYNGGEVEKLIKGYYSNKK